MKLSPRIAYFYVSTPEILHPEIQTLPPDRATLCIESDTFPREVPMVLNIAIVNLEKGTPYSFHIKMLLDGREISIGSTEATQVRFKSYESSEGNFALRHSFFEKYMLDEPGCYTFIVRLYDEYLSSPPTDSDKFSHQMECSIAVAREWR
ncbi:hypothetical protein [Citrobacter braakii]|uniref:hypothetical protein n=1 Tax=Citrobacter braakii TaxID=57706 RepID=UPI0039B5544E